jgi:ATP-dependent helicase/nuclease subunit B
LLRPRRLRGFPARRSPSMAPRKIQNHRQKKSGGNSRGETVHTPVYTASHMPLAAPIADAVVRGATVVAASPRAARALALEYAESQRSAGREIWPSPPILDWDSWLRSLWRDYSFAHPDAPMLLSPLQEQVLWTRQQRDDAARVVSRSALAALAMEAWSLLSDYNAHAARTSAWDQTDAERFRHWAAAFERECARQGWISFSQIAPLLAAGSTLALPPEICLIGFDRLTPAQRDFLAALSSRGVRVDQPPLPPRESRRSWRVASDLHQEIAACADWARGLLVENPGARIGVIAPGAAALRGPIDRAFRRILMPATEDILAPSVELPWEFSLGQPLAEVPAIHAALLLLRWIADPLPEEDISWLLLSGFVSDTVTNPLAVALHDARARRATLLLPQRSLADYARGLPSTPEFRTLRNDLAEVRQAIEANRVLTQSRLPSAFAELVHLLLDRYAWPGRRTPDSVEFQSLQRWQRLLDDLALLDFDGQLCDYSEFLRLLESHARETIFAPESHDAPIQIMGPLESSGQTFDALWFLRTDSTAWPQPGRFHPLLPPAVQRQYNLPSSTPEDDWNLAHAVTARLLASAPLIVFSYAERDNDAELRPSPLIASLFASDAQPEQAVAPSSATARIPLDPIPDDPAAPPWPAHQHAGGADVIRRQSACPFQAFAAKRLAADPLDAADRGLDPAEKGKILHKVLQNFFAEVPTHAELVTVIDTNRLEPLLDRHIASVLAPYFSPDPWQQSYLAAEKRRLHARLAEWLQYEKQRVPFTVEKRERDLPDVRIGDLRLRLRADRVDILSNGSRLLIDYKTGSVSPASWRTERPEEPQLPLYAAYGNIEDLSGVVFAKIRAGETCFAGHVENAQTQLLPTLGDRSALVADPYSPQMRDDWAQVLANLAAQFLSGESAVDPRKPSVCDYCEFPSLCRKAELDLVAADENGEEDADG